jgi:ureidoacrylate peracid hydrolase
MTETNGHGGHTYRLAGEPGTGFPPERTALLVIDPVNDFLSEGGAAWDLTRGTVRKHDVVGHLAAAIAGARERGIPVLFAPMAFTLEDYAKEELHRRSGIHRIMFERRMFLAGSWGADFHPDLQPEDGEIVLTPHKGSDVFETDLPDHLQQLGTTHLVIAGLLANLCCEGTGRHASEHGYDVTFLRDAIGAVNLASYEASIRISYPMIGNAVLDVEQFLAVLDAAGRRAQPGDTVIGSDQLKIGTVAEVVAGDDGSGHLRVARSVLSSDTYIPLDAVVKVTDGTAFVHAPRIIVGKLPWGDPPTTHNRTAKLGPPLADVDALYRSRSPSTQGSGVVDL